MSLSVATGPMFSGKTSYMVKEVCKYTDLSSSVSYAVVINHSLDDRDREKLVSSHASLYKGLSDKVDVVSTPKLADVDVSGYVVIGVDEANFFDDLVETVRTWLDQGKHIICAGLDSDFKMRPFGNIHGLLHMADSFVKLNAVCTMCMEETAARGEIITPTNTVPAPFTRRIGGDNNKLIDIGGDDKYIAVCRKHHKYN